VGQGTSGVSLEEFDNVVEGFLETTCEVGSNVFYAALNLAILVGLVGWLGSCCL
jgi:hypothetical protein